MSVAKRASVIVPNWNGRRFLRRCFDSLRKQVFSDFEVVLVDNASTDDSVSFTRGEYPEVRVIELRRNLGYAGAINAGVEQADGEYLAFLNNDTEADPLWLQELVLCLERHEQAACAASKMLRLDAPNILDGAGDSLNWYLIPYPRGRGEEDLRQFEEEVEVFSASGGASLWRASALADIGLLDESFFAYYEDVDLGFRAILAGYECWYAPKAIVYHAVGGTSSEDALEFAFFHSTKNRWYLVAKDVPLASMCLNAHKILFAEGLMLRRAIARRKLGAVLRAYGRVVRNLPQLLRKRRAIQKRRAASHADLARLVSPKFPPLGHRVWRALR